MATIDLHDPASLRALANPVRLRILGALRRDGAHTVGELAALVDAAPGSVSYHLTTLRDHGFVEEAPELARDARERWWRARHDVTSYHPGELSETPEGAAASRAFREAILQAHLVEQLAYLDNEPSLAREWIDAATQSDSLTYLSVAELAELSAELEALAERWQRPRPEVAADADDTPEVVPVRLLFSTFRQA